MQSPLLWSVLTLALLASPLSTPQATAAPGNRVYSHSIPGRHVGCVYRHPVAAPGYEYRTSRYEARTTGGYNRLFSL